MGWLHDGHRALMRQARAADATTVVSIFVNPRQFNVADDFTQVPAQRGARPRHLRVGGRRHRLRPRAVGDLPARLRHGRVGRGGRPAARGCGPARPLRRGRDGRRDPVRPRRRGARVLRPEGRPAGHGHPPDGARPGHPDRGHRLPDRPRAGRPGAVVAERPPVARRSERRRRSSTAPCWRPARAGRPGERSAEALRATMREELAREPLAEPDYVSVADGDDPGRARPGRRPGPAVAGRPVRHAPASSTTSRSSPIPPPDAGHGCRRADPPRLPHLLRGDRGRLPVPAGLLP